MTNKFAFFLTGNLYMLDFSFFRDLNDHINKLLREKVGTYADIYTVEHFVKIVNNNTNFFFVMIRSTGRTGSKSWVEKPTVAKEPACLTGS
jgi:hypothetical protein